MRANFEQRYLHGHIFSFIFLNYRATSWGFCCGFGPMLESVGVEIYCARHGGGRQESYITWASQVATRARISSQPAS